MGKVKQFSYACCFFLTGFRLFVIKAFFTNQLSFIYLCEQVLIIDFKTKYRTQRPLFLSSIVWLSRNNAAQ